MSRLSDTRYAVDKLAWMRKERIWPNGLRYLWTDAFGVVLLVICVAAFGGTLRGCALASYSTW